MTLILAKLPQRCDGVAPLLSADLCQLTDSSLDTRLDLCGLGQCPGDARYPTAGPTEAGTGGRSDFPKGMQLLSWSVS